jgi:hypothetical protein
MKIKNLKLLAVVLFFAFKSNAADPPAPQPSSIPPPVGAQVPIDSNILVLMSGGIVLGLFFIFKSNKSKKIGNNL